MKIITEFLRLNTNTMACERIQWLKGKDNSKQAVVKPHAPTNEELTRLYRAPEMVEGIRETYVGASRAYNR